MFYQQKTICIVYVDGDIFASPSNAEINQKITEIGSKFDIEDQGTLDDNIIVNIEYLPTGISSFRKLIWLTKQCRTKTSCEGRRQAQYQSSPAWLYNYNFKCLPSTPGSTTAPSSQISTFLRRSHKETYTMWLTKFPASARTHVARPVSPLNISMDTSAKSTTADWFWSKTYQVLRSVYRSRILWELVLDDCEQWPLDCKNTIMVCTIICRATYFMGF